jgi:UDP-glucose 4-epimerase
VSKERLSVEHGPRRDGDPPELVADSSNAKKVLAWHPEHNLQSIIQSAWQWHSLAAV